MASTSSNMVSLRPNHAWFDVFLSFRGEDTRYSFTDHLYAALNRAAIHAFRDNNEIKRGEHLEPEIVKAIENSRASIVILSENYAKSTWCLEELWLILQQRRKGHHFVLPVFYLVDPSDVRKQRQSFAIEGSKWTEENVNRWKSALREVANLAGVVVSGFEADFIANIVDTIDYELDSKLVSTPAHLTGMETRAKEISSWLKNEHFNTNALSICGMGGSGKTTLARYIYNSDKHNFEGSCFLEEIGKHLKETYGVLGLQKQLLSGILGGKNKMISCVAEGTTKINEVLQMKKVLIVLDDIDDLDILGALLGKNVAHIQSKIIVTTRLLDIHLWFESIYWRCRVHDLKLLNDQESLEVFSFHAFGSKLPLEGFNDLAVKLAQYCGGNPLALKVLGSSLYVSTVEDQRERNNIIERWRSRLNSLSSLKGDLDRNIQGVLQKSFDSLPLPSYKELFLHIALFFVGEDEDYVVKILDRDWRAKVGITTLINRCLLTISSKKKLVMHQLLQDMGRNIVCEESKYSAKHTRVWCSDEAYRMLTNEEGLETIEGLALDIRKLDKGTKVINSLKILNLTNCMKLVSIRKLERLPNLETLILWCCINLTHVCRTIAGLESLALLNLAGCEKLWKASLNKERLNAICIGGGIPEKPLFFLPRSLKFLFLDDCNLEHHIDLGVAFSDLLFGMSLRGNLFEIMPNNLNLTMLRVLNLNYCKNLKSILCLPSTLEELYTYGCKSLEKVTFQSARFRLQKFGYGGCIKLSEVQGLFKLVAIKKLDDADMGHMKWIKAYQDHKVDLDGDEITKGRNWHNQMLYEYGIRSTYLQGIKDHSNIPVNHYTSACRFFSFRVTSHAKERGIQGLNVSFLYRSPGCEDQVRWLFYIKVSNITKDVTWIYNPVVYCKPKVDEDAMWLSYWPIGNILDEGDKIYVHIIMHKEMIVRKCGATLVYMDEIVQEENLQNKTTNMEEVIGGDLSDFQLTTGVYYLCRRDFFKLASPDLIKGLFGACIPYTELQGWRKSYQSRYLDASFMHLEYIEELHEDILYKGIMLGIFDSKIDILAIKDRVSRLMGVDDVYCYTQKRQLYILGCVDSMAVKTCVKEFERTVKILTVNYNAKPTWKRYHMDNVMWGTNFITKLKWK